MRGKFNRIAALVAGSYWALMIVAFLLLQLAGFDMIGHGALLIIALTLPSSLLMLLAHPSLPPDPSRPWHDPLASSFATFALFSVICGGVNASAIYWLVSTIQRRRQRKI